MLFYNSCDFNFTSDLSGQLRDLQKSSSKVTTKSLESDDSSPESDDYICDLSIDEQIDVEFFDQLNTPSDEVKPFPSLEEAPSIVSTHLPTKPTDSKASISKKVKSLSIVIDENMEPESVDRSREISATSHEATNSSEPLTTPVVDPNSSLATADPVFPLADMDALSNYFIPDLSRFQPRPDSHQSPANLVSSPSTLITSSLSSSSSPRHHPQTGLAATCSSSSFTNLVSQDFFTSIMALNETLRPSTASSGYLTPTQSPIQTSTASYSSSMTSPSTALIYHELTPPSASSNFSSLVPTVVEDHPYHTRRTSASPMTSLEPPLSPGPTSTSSAPSPCPSTSSMASCSTVDCKDVAKDLLSFSGHDSVLSHKVVKDNVNETSRSSSRKVRLTKKEKLDSMVSREKRLASENSQLRKQVDTISRDVKNLKGQLIEILRKPYKRGPKDDDTNHGAS